MGWHKNKILFPTDEREDWVSFEFGAPSADLLPVELLKRSALQAADEPEAWTQLQYGPSLGDRDVLESLAIFLSAEYRSRVSARNLALTSGASQSFWNLISIFSSPATKILIENPTYFLAVKMCREFGLEMIPCRSNENGIDLNDLLANLIKDGALENIPLETKDGSKKFRYILYLVPTLSNPMGICAANKRDFNS